MPNSLQAGKLDAVVQGLLKITLQRSDEALALSVLIRS